MLAGFARGTLDVDLLIDTSFENEAFVYKAIEILPDKAVRELKPGDTWRYGVVRAAGRDHGGLDEIRGRN
ncbi:MAG TPA: hypothetical protein VH229_06020 [Candidatus Udaeobacter sp.]|nr:hypothetical protein [Candidatus Udaeobacter sp.]